MSTYQPSAPPQDVRQIPAWLNREMLSLKQAQERAQPHLTWEYLHAEPEKIVAGMEVLADGSDWDPGSISTPGKYRRSADNTSWELIESTAVAAALAAHIADTSDAHDASAISNVPAGTIAATDVQAAINELDGDIQAHIGDTSDAHDASAISILDTAGDFTATDVEGALAELQSDHEADAQALADHIADTADAHDASAISILDAAGDFTATDVEGALAELQSDHEADAQGLADHIADGTAAHAASAISFSPVGTIAGTDVQTAVAEVATDAATALSNHEAAADPHPGYLTPAEGNAAYQPVDTQLTSLAALSYAGNGSKVVRLNAGETDFEFASAGAGTGDVVGPGLATDGAVALFDGVTGKLIKDSTVAGTALYYLNGTDVAINDGGTGASTAADARTNLGATTVGANIFTLANPGAITWARMNADNTVTARSASETRTDIGLGTSATVDTGTSGATIPLLNGANTWSAAQTFTSAGNKVSTAAPNWYFEETDQGADLKLWRFLADGGFFRLQTRTDADGAGINAWSIDRSGNISWAGTGTGDGSGLTSLNATQLTSGTVNDARLPTSMATKTFTGTSTFSGLVDVTNGQIKFPAAQNASADVNTLDDYQEDSAFTPTLAYAGGSTGITYTAQVGQATKIGNRVFFDLTIILSNKGSSTGAILISGLPVAQHGGQSTGCSLYMTSVTSGVGDTHLAGLILSGTSTIRVTKIVTGSAQNMTDADLTNTSTIRLQGSYRVA